MMSVFRRNVYFKNKKKFYAYSYLKIAMPTFVYSKPATEVQLTSGIGFNYFSELGCLNIKPEYAMRGFGLANSMIWVC